MDDQKRMMAGKFCFAMLSLFSTSAFLCGLIASGFCSFVARNIELAEGYTPLLACRAIGLDPSSCAVFLDNHGVGFYGWQGTVAYNETVCLSYTQVCGCQRQILALEQAETIKFLMMLFLSP